MLLPLNASRPEITFRLANDKLPAPSVYNTSYDVPPDSTTFPGAPRLILPVSLVMVLPVMDMLPNRTLPFTSRDCVGLAVLTPTRRLVTSK